MTKEQRAMLGSDYGFAILPYHFKEAITKHCNYNYKNEKIDNVLSADLGSLGKFWKFIDGTTYVYLEEDDSLMLEQKEGQEVSCLVPLLKGVEKVIVYYKNDFKEYETHKSIFKNVDVCTIDFKFDNQIEKLELHFNYNIVEPLTINVKTTLYEKPMIDTSTELLKTLNATHSCGQDLVNIKFQYCNENVSYTKISLYDDNKQLMGAFKVDAGMFYKSITNLAFGKYFYKVAQYDKENKLIVSTDFIEFKIFPTSYGNGKMQVVN